MRSNGSAKQNSNDASRPRLGVGSLLGDTTAAQPKSHLNWQKNCLDKTSCAFTTTLMLRIVVQTLSSVVHHIHVSLSARLLLQVLKS